MYLVVNYPSFEILQFKLDLCFVRKYCKHKNEFQTSIFKLGGTHDEYMLQVLLSVWLHIRTWFEFTNLYQTVHQECLHGWFKFFVIIHTSKDTTLTCYWTKTVVIHKSRQFCFQVRFVCADICSFYSSNPGSNLLAFGYSYNYTGISVLPCWNCSPNPWSVKYVHRFSCWNLCIVLFDW